jgi:hypothetical protein
MRSGIGFQRVPRVREERDPWAKFGNAFGVEEKAWCVCYAEGVSDYSPGSRSAPWVTGFLLSEFLERKPDPSQGRLAWGFLL